MCECTYEERRSVPALKKRVEIKKLCVRVAEKRLNDPVPQRRG